MTGKFLIATGLYLVASLFPGSATETLAATIVVPTDIPTIGAALEAAQSGDRVEVAPGVYNESGLTLPNGVALVGQSGEPADVVIDGGLQGRILLLESLDQTSLVANLTFRAGRAAGRTSYERSGGAIFCSNSNARISNCVFVDNVSDGHGGAIRCVNSTPLITGCVFRGNRADGGGGGAIDCSFGSSPLVRGCEFTDNAAAWGGALSARGYSAPKTYASVFAGNTAVGAKGYGGAVFADIGAEATFEQVTVYANEARYGGGFACMGTAQTDLTGCTVTDNIATVLGGGLFAYESSPNVTSSIIAFQQGAGVAAEGGGLPVITCSNIYGNSQGDWVGTISTQLSSSDNITADPLFCGTGTGAAAYALEEGSPSGDEALSCGVMGAWPVGCSTSVPAVFTFEADWDDHVVHLTWEALLYGQPASFRVTGARAATPQDSWEIPFQDLGGGFYEAVDDAADGAGEYIYRLYMGDGSGSWTLVDEAGLTAVPGFRGIRDLKAFPNPFNPVTTIGFRLGSSQQARVAVYTPDGCRIAVLADREFPAGAQSVSWDGRTDDGRPAGSGVYIVLVEGASERLTRKITMLK